MTAKECMRDMLDSSVFRFILAGGSSTLLDYVIYWPLSTSINYNAAKAISMTCACVYSYLLNKTFTFRNTGSNSISLAVKYVFAQIINITVNTGINAFVFRLTEMKLLAMVCATCVAMTVNYLLQKYFVFVKKEK